MWMRHIDGTIVQMNPRTEEIGLTIITTAKISNKFSRESPYIQTRFLGSPQNFNQGFTWVNGVPVSQKIYSKIG